MKILTLWLGAFWFAINKLLWENNEDMTFYWLELKKDICDNISKTREHPYFFEWYKLPNNIEIINNYDDIIGEVDLLILAIPAQFIEDAIKWLDKKLKVWVTILNLAKWIDIRNNLTISQLIKKEFRDFEYNYAILSWWMIAEEVVKWKKIWADLACTNSEILEEIKNLFINDYFKINIRKEILNIELYWSLKNILAIITGYYEWQWEAASTIWYYINEFYNEMKDIIYIYGWSKNLDFSYYSLGWDIIATCFWNSRNRYFWRLLWKWKNVKEVLEILKSEKKHAEWYETFKAVYDKIWDREGFQLLRDFYEIIK
jgi:glycerol-3-phosphate dehydrogenase (NAD(P)+)